MRTPPQVVMIRGAGFGKPGMGEEEGGQPRWTLWKEVVARGGPLLAGEMG